MLALQHEDPQVRMLDECLSFMHRDMFQENNTRTHEGHQTITWADKPSTRCLLRTRESQVMADRRQNVCVVLDNLNNPQNVAACLRTVEALGIPLVHIVNCSTNKYNHISKQADKWINVSYYQTAAESREVRGRYAMASPAVKLP